MTLKEWLYSIEKTQVWLSHQLGENIRTVNSWATGRSSIPQRHAETLRSMGFEGHKAHARAHRLDRGCLDEIQNLTSRLDDFRRLYEACMGDVSMELNRLNAKVDVLLTPRKKSPPKAPLKPSRIKR